MNKESLTERDICIKYIVPAIQSAGWDIQHQVREEHFFIDSQVLMKGKTVKRGKRKFADFVLSLKPNMPLAIIEAKDNNHSVGSGMQQGLEYARTLDIPFVFSTNGDSFLFHDRLATAGTVEQELALDQFPSTAELWQRYRQAKGINEAKLPVITQDYYSDGSGRTPRYYQSIAINRTVEAVSNGQKRALLVMATGTGKTFTAFQLIWRLWKSGKAKRILFLADRNILVDQTKSNDFKPFGSAMTKIKDRKIDKSHEIYLSLYQAVSGSEEENDIYRQFSPDFFDLIVIDECHRGSPDENSAWRKILDYFSSATHVGLTATPKETEDVSNSHYFGEPVYTYSLKQGIEDGFLAPYKVIRIDFDKDIQGWRPQAGQVDKHGQVIDDRIYNQKDMDRNLVMEQRTALVAKKVTEFLKATNRFDKTIVFCDDIDRAERMRKALVNENADLVAQNHKYIMQITGDNAEGKAELDQFIQPEEKYPVIAFTSALMTTGVDAKTRKLILLDKHIKSMTKFKQIIDRGTRIDEDYDKLYFTIMDFKTATELFADPDFDGDPVQIYQPGPTDPPLPPDDGETDTSDGDGVTGTGSGSESGTGTGGNGKEPILAELEENGVLIAELAEHVGKDFDPFDLVCHVAFDQPPLTRRERADNVKKRNYFAKYGEQTRAVLLALLEKYADEGIETIESPGILKVQPLDKFGTPVEIIRLFGGADKYQSALKELESALYTLVK